MKKYFKNFALPFLFTWAVLGCTGAMESPGGGPPGGNLQAQGSEGVLGSQSDVQNMSNTCGTSYKMKFQGDGSADSDLWYIMQKDQKTFPTPGIIVSESKGPNVNDDICEDCEGKTVRVIDFGDPKFDLLREATEFSGMMMGIWKQDVKPELISQARYQDFTVSAVGDVSFKGYGIEPFHVYLILLSNKIITPVTESTAFNSKEEFYTMTGCSNDPESHPFVHLSAFQARYSEPTGLKMPPGGFKQLDPNQGNDDQSDSKGSGLTVKPAVVPVDHKFDLIKPDGDGDK